MKPVMKSTVVSTLMAMGLGTSAFLMPAASQAEVSSGLNLSSMYLWRGQDISNAAPAFSGSVDYSHDSGIFLGTWASSEGASGSHEVDLYAGWAGKAGPVDITVGVYEYLYPEAVDGTTGENLSLSDSDISEYLISLGFADFSFSAYINTEGKDFDDYKYYSLDYSIDKIGLHVGMTDTSVDAANYTDFNVSYALTDAASIIVSMASGDAVGDDPGMLNGDPMVVFSYDIPLEMK